MYHGTDTIITAVDLNKSRLRTDFGKGFYLSSKLGVAHNWAVDKSGATKIPIIMRFTLNTTKLNTPELLVLRFDQPTVEWLDFIRGNRQIKAIPGVSGEPRHNYDVVSGPIATLLLSACLLLLYSSLALHHHLIAFCSNSNMQRLY